MIEEKKCKGTGKAKGFGCGVMVKARLRKYGLGNECGCWSYWLQNSKEGKELVKRATLKVTKPKRELAEAEHERKITKSISALKNDVVLCVHRYIRERDKHLPCISCGCNWHSDFQAGHFYKAELYSALKFQFYNINGQCVKCNVREEGNLNQYAINLPKRIGQTAFDVLKTAAEESKKLVFKWDREELIKIRNEANKLYKELKNENSKNNA